MAVIDLPMVGQSYHLQDWSIDCQCTLNLYPQVVESQNAPQVVALLPTEGLVKRYEFAGAIRGLYALNDRVLVVAGQSLHVIKNNQSERIGDVSGDDLVTFADNSLHVMIVGGDAYRYVIASNQLSKLTIDDKTGFFGAANVTFLDSRFVWVVPDTSQIQWSDLLDTSTTALSYATAEAKSDNLVRVVASNGQLWLIGSNTTEVWNTTGSQDLPFQRMSGAYLPVGCSAPNSIAEFGQSLVWLSQTNHGHAQIVMTQGYQTVRISNHAIESEISSYSRIDDAYAFAYQQSGHSFYVLSFPTAQKTWVYDAVSQMWHERSYFNADTNKHEHHRAMTHCFFNSEHLVGDRQNGLVYRLCPRCPTDNGGMVIRERVTPVINPQGQRLIFDEVELICQVGQSTNTNPLVVLDWSDDKGKTWSNTRLEQIGGIGEFSQRVVFRRLGQSFNRVFRLRCSDPAHLVIMGAKARVR